MQRDEDAAKHVLRDDQELEDLHRRALVGQRGDRGEPESAAQQAAGQAGPSSSGQLAGRHPDTERGREQRRCRCPGTKRPGSPRRASPLTRVSRETGVTNSSREKSFSRSSTIEIMPAAADWNSVAGEHPGERERHRVEARDPAHGGLQDAAQPGDEHDGERQVDRQPRAVAQELDHVALGDDQQRGQLVRRAGSAREGTQAGALTGPGP